MIASVLWGVVFWPASFRETCQWLKISPEWVTGPAQGKSSGRIATFSLWTGMFRDGISCIAGETVIPLWLGRHFLVCENRGIQRECVNDCSWWNMLYRCDSVVVSSFVRTGVYHEEVRMTVPGEISYTDVTRSSFPRLWEKGYTTRRWGWLSCRIGYSIMQITL